MSALVGDYTDLKTGISVHDLYGKNRDRAGIDVGVFDILGTIGKKDRALSP